MTHDELLARLSMQIAYSKAIGCECSACDNAVALQAVIELHKPEKEKLAEPFVVDFCHKCKQIYPCETIEIIEKELQ